MLRVLHKAFGQLIKPVCNILADVRAFSVNLAIGQLGTEGHGGVSIAAKPGQLYWLPGGVPQLEKVGTTLGDTARRRFLLDTYVRRTARVQGRFPAHFGTGRI